MTDEHSLDRFAQHGFYQDVNRRLVALTALRRGQRVVDLGAGTGAVTRMIAAEVEGSGGGVIAVEPSQPAIDVALGHGAYPGQASVRFVRGDVRTLPSLLDRPADAVFFCNAIHLIQEKQQLLRQIRTALGPGGTLSLNTSFFAGAEPPEAEQFYRRWMMKSLRVLKSRHGLSPQRNKVEARHRLTGEEYAHLLVECGYRVRTQEVMTVQMPLGGFEDISRYSLWIEGVMPGVALAAGCDSLMEGARQAFSELGLTASPRCWLLIVANPA